MKKNVNGPNPVLVGVCSKEAVLRGIKSTIKKSVINSQQLLTCIFFIWPFFITWLGLYVRLMECFGCKAVRFKITYRFHPLIYSKLQNCGYYNIVHVAQVHTEEGQSSIFHMAAPVNWVCTLPAEQIWPMESTPSDQHCLRPYYFLQEV